MLRNNDGDEAARNERLEGSDRWIPTLTRSKSSKTLKLPRIISVEWSYLAANGRKGGEF
jgi:hypothetical protein